MITTLTEGQTTALTAVQEGGNILVLGDAGSGKSSLLDIEKVMFGHESVFGATTGVANQGLFNSKGGAGTAHKIFSLPTQMSNNKNTKLNRYTSELFKTDAIRKVFIDEVGTLSPDSLAIIQKRINRFNKPTATREGRDIQLILSGDVLQIPTILKGIDRGITVDRYGSTLFFKTEMFKQMDFKIVYLDQVMRAEDPEFKHYLDIVRYGVETKMTEALKYFNQRYVPDLPQSVPELAIRNDSVEVINNKALLRNPNPCGSYRATIEGAYKMKNCPVEGVLQLKRGLPVITLHNHKEGNFNNGSSGVVENLTREGVYVRFNHSNEVHLVEPIKFTENETYIAGEERLEDGTVRPLVKQREVGSAECIPIKLASAMTINRAQGRTLDAPAILDLGVRGFRENTDFGTAMTYVGLSRFTKIGDIFLKHPLTKEHIKVCRETIAWLSDNVEGAEYNPNKYT